jgi:hypothetical protein
MGDVLRLMEEGRCLLMDKFECFFSGSALSDSRTLLPMHRARIANNNIPTQVCCHRKMLSSLGFPHGW